MKRLSHVWRAAAVLAATMILLSVRLAADVILLKTGEQNEGRIIAEDDRSVTLEYQLTTKIKDRVVILKVNIAKIIRQTPSEVEFRAKRLSEVVPSRDLMTVADYDVVLERLRLFAAKHPGTPEAVQARDMIETLTEERSQVQAGQLKMEGAWLDADTAKREHYEIDAYRRRFAMKDHMADAFGEPTAPKEARALRVFEEMRTQFSASIQFPKAIPEALEILNFYDRRLEQMVKEYPVLAEQRMQALQAMGSRGTTRDLFLRTDRTSSEEERTFREKFEAQTKSGQKWRDVYKYDLRSIEIAQRSVVAEREELEAINLVALKFENENLGSARRCLLDDKPAEAEEFMNRLRPIRKALLNEGVLEELERLLAEKSKR